MRRVLDSLIVFLPLFILCQSVFPQSQIPSTDGRKILVDSFVVSGTQAIDAAE